ncbi:MAG: glycoside hydrolase family 5 protein [Treponema sp.]|nr:glycoside hydrolase family 5 protein [Treponema sp.]
MKKILSLFVVSLLLINNIFALPKLVYNTKKAVVDSGEKKEIKLNSSIELTKLMKTGWNLGNTMDSLGGTGLQSETSWGQPKTSQIMIEMLADSGIKTIRIPVSWANHLIDGKYTIDPAWITRVKEIVDWAIEYDMYVVLNTHHDNFSSPKKMGKGKGYYPNSVNLAESSSYLANVWTQIGNAFNNSYDEHLIFETMNEPRLVGTDREWYNAFGTEEYKDAADSLNKLNQIALDAIRATGGNNEKRFVIVPGLRAAVDSVLADEFKLPDDKESGRLLVSVHMYTPYKFAMEAPGVKRFVDAHKMELETYFSRLDDKFAKNGVGIFVGEYGATNKDNDEYRLIWFESFLTSAKNHNAICCLWDNGVDSADPKHSEHFGFFDRKMGMWFNEDFINKINEIYSK